MQHFDWVAAADDPAQYYRSAIAGTYRTSWDFLRLASMSSYFKSAEALASVAASWEKTRANHVADGEVAFLLEFNYRINASGVLLSATLTPALALESFVRLAAQVALHQVIDDGNAVFLAVNGLDALAFRERIGTMLKLIGVPPLSKELSAQIDALVAFRNAVSHDTPQLFHASGRMVQAKRGVAKFVDESAVFGGVFPVLSEDAMPLTLRHARHAIGIHDDLVSHVSRQAPKEYLDDFRQLVSPAYRDIGIITEFGGKHWTQAEGIAEYWEAEVLPWLESVSEDDRTAFALEAKRRLTVRIVSDGTEAPAEGKDGGEAEKNGGNGA